MAEQQRVHCREVGAWNRVAVETFGDIEIGSSTALFDGGSRAAIGPGCGWRGWPRHPRWCAAPGAAARRRGRLVPVQ